MANPRLSIHSPLIVDGNHNHPWLAFRVRNPSVTNTLLIGDVVNFTIVTTGQTIPDVKKLAFSYDTSSISTTISARRAMVAGVVWNSDIATNGGTGIVAAAGLLPTRVHGGVDRGDYLAGHTNQAGHLGTFDGTMMYYAAATPSTPRHIPPGFCARAYEAADTGSNILRCVWWPWRF